MGHYWSAINQSAPPELAERYMMRPFIRPPVGIIGINQSITSAAVSKPLEVCSIHSSSGARGVLRGQLGFRCNYETKRAFPHSLPHTHTLSLVTFPRTGVWTFPGWMPLALVYIL